MSTENNPIKEVIAEFVSYINEQRHIPESDTEEAMEKVYKANDDFLGFVLDRVPEPAYHKDTVKDTLELTEDQKAELDEFDPLLNGHRAENPLWKTPEDLYELATKYPPVLLETMLPIAMMIYILRALGTNLHTETPNFARFYDGWHYLVFAR